MRDEIIAEIKRVAASTGKAPGRRIFERETGIRPSAWLGVYWARWGDALREAGLDANDKQGRTDRDFIIEKIAAAVRHYGRTPAYSELRLYARTDPTFPAHSTISNRFQGKGDWIEALRDWVSGKPEYDDVAAMLPAPAPTAAPTINATTKPTEGHVYLIKSGDFYKIGRSDELERRVKEIRIALPDAATLAHSIRTDDPPGIEAYWHRRFADKRANGEWFKLSSADVAAFRRRKFQ
jgi:hypothetical protein